MTAEDRVVVNAEAGQNELSSFESVAFLHDESNLNLKEKSRFKRKRERSYQYTNQEKNAASSLS